MTSYWWVNHKQTFKHEIEGGYLWSPKIKSNGDRNYFYDKMADAAVGDVVLSYANAKIAYFGIVVEEASTSSVNKYPSTMRQRSGNVDKYGATETLYKIWRALITASDPPTTHGAAPDIHNWANTTCDAPPKTIADIKIVCHSLNPLAIPKTPNTKPKGATPNCNGN